MNRSMETSWQNATTTDETSDETDKTEQISQSTQYDLFPIVTVSVCLWRIGALNSTMLYSISNLINFMRDLLKVF